MPLKNFKNVGELQGYEYLKGTITEIDRFDESCTLVAKDFVNDALVDVTYSAVPFYYHCNPNAEELENGGLKGGSWAFKTNDEVVVLRQKHGAPDGTPNGYVTEPKIFVVGFTDGPHQCDPVVMVYSTQSGDEAIAWDIVSNEPIGEKEDLATLLSKLSDATLSEQIELVPDEERDECYLTTNNGGMQCQGFKGDDDQPVFIVYGKTANSVEPFKDGTTWKVYPAEVKFSDIASPCSSGYTGWTQPYFIDPDDDTETPRCGKWVAYSFGSIAAWDTDEWGECPYEENQIYWFNVSQIFLHFRSLFHYNFANGNPGCNLETLTTELMPVYLDAYTEKLFDECADGEFFHIEDIDIDVWLESGQTQASYDSYVAHNADYLAYPTRPFHMVLPHDPLVDFASGIATYGKTSLFFEFCGVYPNSYDFYDKDQVLTEEMKLKYRSVFNIYYRQAKPPGNIQSILFYLVNKERESAGLDPLFYHHKMQIASQRHADDMAENLRSSVVHTGSDGSTSSERILEAGVNALYKPKPGESGTWVGENIYRAPIPLQPVELVVSNPTGIEIEGLSEIIGWMQSPGHAANIVLEDYKCAGMAVKRGPDGYTYICQDFMGHDSDYEYLDWDNFTPFDSTDLKAYLMENFEYNDTGKLDNRRVPKVYLCTIPEA